MGAYLFIVVIFLAITITKIFKGSERRYFFISYFIFVIFSANTITRSTKVQREDIAHFCFCLSPYFWLLQSYHTLSSKVRREDMGAYLCIASNDVPPAVSKRVYLMVQCESLDFNIFDIFDIPRESAS